MQRCTAGTAGRVATPPAGHSHAPCSQQAAAHQALGAGLGARTCRDIVKDPHLTMILCLMIEQYFEKAPKQLELIFQRFPPMVDGIFLNVRWRQHV